jgi:hypothetical protein
MSMAQQALDYFVKKNQSMTKVTYEYLSYFTSHILTIKQTLISYIVPHIIRTSKKDTIPCKFSECWSCHISCFGIYNRPLHQIKYKS